jgi:hypothetical protein
MNVITNISGLNVLDTKYDGTYASVLERSITVLLGSRIE